EAEGLNAADAQARAEQAAEVMVQKAAEFREASKRATTADDVETMAHAPLPPLVDVKTLLELPDTPEQLPKVRRPGAMGKMISWLFSLLFGPMMRFVVGALLLAGCLLWMRDNGLFPGSVPTDLDEGQTALQKMIDLITTGKLKPLELPWVPSFVGEL